MIVSFAWWICLDGIRERRKTEIILILTLLDDPYHIALKFQFFTFLPDFTADEMLLEAIDDTDSSNSSISSSSSMAAAASLLSTKPKPFSQGQLNDLVHLWCLRSRLAKHGILDPGTKIALYHDRDDLLIRFFTMEDDFVYCNNIQGLFSEMGLPEYNADG